MISAYVPVLLPIAKLKSISKYLITSATINEIGYECVGVNNGIVRNLELKTLMCQLINDRGLLEICKKYGLIVSNLKEIKYYRNQYNIFL